MAEENCLASAFPFPLLWEEE